MQWNELQYIKKKEDIPEKGQVLAYTRQKVIFHAYENLENVEAELSGEELLELHLFDKAKEYRCVSTRSRRFPSGIIETLVSFQENEKDKRSGIGTIYQETVRLDMKSGRGSDQGKDTLTVLNHIRYDEKGMAALDNYRLKM